MNPYVKQVDFKNHLTLLVLWLSFLLQLLFVYVHVFIMLVYLGAALYFILVTVPKERLKKKILVFYLVMWLSMLAMYFVIYINLLFIFALPLIGSWIYLAVHLFKHPRSYKTNLEMHQVQYKEFIALIWLFVFIFIFKTNLMYASIYLIVILIKDQMELMKEMKVFEKRMPLIFITLIMFFFAYLSTSVDIDQGRSYNILFNINYIIIFLLTSIHLIWSKKTYEKHVLETKEKKIK